MRISDWSSDVCSSDLFAESQGYAVDWNAVAQLDDEALVNGIGQMAPFDAAAKQALLEVDGLTERAELIIQLMQFFGRHDGDERAPLQCTELIRPNWTRTEEQRVGKRSVRPL